MTEGVATRAHRSDKIVRHNVPCDRGVGIEPSRAHRSVKAARHNVLCERDDEIVEYSQHFGLNERLSFIKNLFSMLPGFPI